MTENKPVLERHQKAAEIIFREKDVTVASLAQIIANAEPLSINDAELLDRIQACTEENTELHKRIERVEALVKDWPHVFRRKVDAILHPKENGR